MSLPTKPQSRAGKAPQQARCIVAGMPKSGKTTLAAAWAPQTTLIIDTHGGSELLDGEHYIAAVASWPAFVQIVADLIVTKHQFQTVVLDLAEDLWRMCDKHHAPRKGDRLLAPLASAANDYQRSAKTAEAIFCDTVGRLLTSPMGVWFITHVREKQEENTTIYAPKLDPKIYSWVHGMCDFIFLAENAGTKRLLHTQPGVQFEAGARVPMPEPLPLDARELWAAMDRGLNPLNYDENGDRKRVQEYDAGAAGTATGGATVEPPAVAAPAAEPDRKDTQPTGSSDVPAEDVWWPRVREQIAAVTTSAELREFLTGEGAVLPENISSWKRTITGLDDSTRARLELWLQDKTDAKAEVPWDDADAERVAGHQPPPPPTQATAA